MWLGVAAYLIPAFPIAFVWHLVLFEPQYHALHIYRADPIIPFGLASMIIQGVVFSWAFPRLFAGNRGSILRAWCRLVVMVIHDTGRCGKAPDGFDL